MSPYRILHCSLLNNMFVICLSLCIDYVDGPPSYRVVTIDMIKHEDVDINVSFALQLNYYPSLAIIEHLSAPIV